MDSQQRKKNHRHFSGAQNGKRKFLYSTGVIDILGMEMSCLKIENNSL